jgi:feruloyl esterase
VVEQCDAKDGLKDGLVEDYLKCNFKPDALLCRKGDADDCLTAPQLTAYKHVVEGSKNPRTGQVIYPGFPIGSPLEGGPVVADAHPDGSAPTVFKLLFQDANFDFHQFNFDTDIARSDRLANNLMNAVEPSRLQAVFAHGGKIIMYHGWNDPNITPLAGIQLYQQAVAANGGLGKTYDEIRLFMVPGMNHCGGGEGPNSFDKLSAISDWVEKGKAPDRIVAAHSTQDKVDRTRPLCPYPQIARYSGSGSIDEAQNFSCAVPK